MEQKGPKLGWLLGGLGGLIWLPILAVVWLAQGKVAGAIGGLIVFAVGVLYVFVMPPWRFPRTPVRNVYLGLLIIVLGGVAVTAWQYYDPRTSKPSDLAAGIALVTLLIPLFTLGHKSWSDLHSRSAPP
jgi:hypothetical protein